MADFATVYARSSVSSAQESSEDLWQLGLSIRAGFGNLPEKETSFQSYVPEKFDGVRLDRYLAIRFKYFSRPHWKELLKERQVLVNGKTEKHTYHVKNKDRISFHGLGVKEPPIPLQVERLYEDDDLLVISKPPHIPIHEGGKYLRHTMVQLVRAKQEEWGIQEELRFLHRLDHDTSGAMLLSKNDHAHRALYRAFEEDQIQKTYLAVAFGIPESDHWVCEAPIGQVPGSQIRIKLWSSPQGLPSETEFTVLDSHRDGFSLLQARPKTGRTNQIRVHAAVSGHPLVGDKTYFPDEEVFLQHQEQGYTYWIHQRVLFHRCLLHAWKISFQHPRSGRRVTVEAPPPQDFRHCLKHFGLKHSGLNLHE